MAKFDVYQLDSDDHLLLDVQADLLDALNTRIVVPLIPLHDFSKPAQRLNPVFEIIGQKYAMGTQFIGAVPKSIVTKPVANLSENFSEITNALDMAFQGF